jgi:glycosyltransferase involved in cell wall biosynthesis
MTQTGKPPKLLFLVTEDWYFVSHRLPLAMSARERGFDVVVATRVREAGAKIRDAGLRLIPIDFERASLSPLSETKTISQLISLYRREAPDIVHHVALKPVLYGAIAARLAGTPAVVNAIMGLGFVFSSNSAKARVLRPAVQRLMKSALGRPGSRTIVQNADDFAFLESNRIAAPGTVRLIPGSGVDVDLYSQAPPPEGVPTIVLPARLIRPKGVMEFVEAARRLIGQGHRARFVLCGAPDPSNPASLSEAEIQKLVQSGIVEHWGWRADMPAVLEAATAVCLPTYYGEGVPKSLIEAAASGRAIVTTDTPGCRDIVKHGVNGWLVAPRDVDALTQALREAITEPETVRRYGEQGRSLVRNGFSLQEIVRQTLAVYDEIVRSR